MKVWLVILVLSFIFSVSLIAKPLPQQLPQDIRDTLNTFPQKAIELDLVVAMALKHMDSFQMIQSELIGQDIASYMASIPLDYQFQATSGVLDNKNKSSSSISPTRTQSNQYSLGVGTYFSSGTALDLSFSNSKTDLTYDPAVLQSSSSFLSSPTTYESKITLGLKQNLWKDGFGYSTRRKLEAGRIGRSVTQLNVQENSEEWALGLIQLYYNAWLAKANVQAEKDNLKRQERLLNITRIKLKRGTAEKPDLLQLESSYMFAKEKLATANQSLMEIWRYLVISLKLPEKWLNIEAFWIPLLIDTPVQTASNMCREGDRDAFKSNTSIAKAEREFRSSQLEFEAAKNAMSPTVALDLRMTSNGLNSTTDEVLNDAIGNKNPSSFIGLTFAMPLSRFSEKAGLSQAFAAKIAKEKQLSSVRGTLKIEWNNECSKLSQLNRQRDAYQLALNSQVERAKLEERRFRLGRIPAFNVIQAGLDVTGAELLLKKSEIDLRITAWKIKQLAGQMQGYFKELATRDYSRVKLGE